MIKHIEENTGGPELNKDLLDKTHKTLIIKERSGKLHFTKFEYRFFSQRHI